MNSIFCPALYRLEPAAQHTLDSAHSSSFQLMLERLLMILGMEQVIPRMTGEELQRIVYLSRFHDIGKQCLPEELLYKPDGLTLEERRMVQQHPVLGGRLLGADPQIRQYPYFDVLYDICLHHHERWDGGGYPDGLKGEHITPYVHALALVDAYDALRTERTYRHHPLSHHEAMEMISHGGCGAFNPKMLDCLQDFSDFICTSCYREEEAG